MAAQTEDLKTLTSLRGVAAVLVACFHVPMLFGVKAIAPHAYLAVDFFFVLSGFVLVHAYGGRMRHGMAASDFTVVRLARLYPLYALATLAGAAMLALRMLAHTAPHDARALIDLPLNLAFVPAGASASNPEGELYPFASQGWSLLWELVVGLALYAWVRKGARFPEALTAASVLVLVALVWRRPSLDGGWQFAGFWIGGARALFGFAAGAMLRLAAPGLTPHRSLLGWGAAGAGVLALGYVLLAPGPSLPVELALVLFGFPLIVIGSALTTSRSLEHRLLEATGHASYSIYLLHGVLGLATAIALARLHVVLPPMAMHLFGPAWIVGLIALSWASWRYVEEPSRRLLMAAWRRRPTGTRVPAGAVAMKA